MENLSSCNDLDSCYFPNGDPVNVDQTELDIPDLTELLSSVRNFMTNELHNVFQHEIIDAEDDLSAGVNPMASLRNVLTDHLVMDMIKEDNMFDFIHVINTFTRSLFAKYKALTGVGVVLMFKGGSVLRAYKDHFLKMIPGSAYDIMEKEFGAFFKPSDLDFSAVIEGWDSFSKEKIRSINFDIEVLVYIALNLSRIAILTNPFLFRICKHNQHSLSKEFSKVIEELNSSKCGSDLADHEIVGIGFHKYYQMDDGSKLLPKIVNNSDKSPAENILLKHGKFGRYDARIISDYDSKIRTTGIIPYPYDLGQLIGFDLHKLTEANSNIFDIYITDNGKMLSASSTSNTHFHLLRLMYNFGVVYRTSLGVHHIANIPSELYDVSILQHDDSNFSHYSLDSLIQLPYKHSYSHDGNDTVWIPSLEGLVLDLYSMLYIALPYPWMQSKYEKRLYRLYITVYIMEFRKLSARKIMSNLKHILTKKVAKKPTSFTLKLLRYMQQKIRTKVDKNSNILSHADRLATTSAFKEYNRTCTHITKLLIKVTEQILKYLANNGKYVKLIG